MKQSIYVQQLHNKPNAPELQNYTIESQLGSGGFGKVYKATNKSSRQVVALKLMSKKGIQSRPERQREKIKKYLQTEPEIMKTCDSPFVIKCYQTFQTVEYEAIVMEYCNGGTLKQAINSRPLAPEKTFKYLREIIQGLAELHKHSIIHRDIKSQNILLHDNMCKIGDFGLARCIQKQSELQHLSYVGTRAYMAPQLHLGQAYGDKADMFSLGVILYQMLHGTNPFSNVNVFMIPNQAISGNYQLSPTLDEPTGSLIRAMMNPRQDDRLNWHQLYTNNLVNPVTNGQRLLSTPQIYKTNGMKKQSKRQQQTRISFELSRLEIINKYIINPILEDKIDADKLVLNELLLLVVNRCIIVLDKVKKEDKIKTLFDDLCGIQLKTLKKITKTKMPQEFQTVKSCDLAEQLSYTLELFKTLQVRLINKVLLSTQRKFLEFMSRFKSLVVAQFDYDVDYINLYK